MIGPTRSIQQAALDAARSAAFPCAGMPSGLSREQQRTRRHDAFLALLYAAYQQGREALPCGEDQSTMKVLAEIIWIERRWRDADSPSREKSMAAAWRIVAQIAQGALRNQEDMA